ncbi:MAG: hypothetical protein M3N51_09960 [Actinomycetota bacterium]|nr:hypothetical protein [Actinomycetota bacterium]
MSLLEARPETPTSTAVVAAAVTVHDASRLEALDAFVRQVYEPAAVFVVGGGDDVRNAAEELGAEWVEGAGSLVAALPEDVTHVWLLHGDVQPRPDALAALVREAERVDASVAGSKLLRADRPELLESVGGASDVFDTPYFGLEQGEVDQQQYDVVRDVAFVPTTSLLVRRDLLQGLGGPDPRLAEEAAGIDFCQRARLAGGRIVVAPSSEVLHRGDCRTSTPAWREQAGRVRAVLKAYRLLTLAWVLPMALAVGVLEAVAATFLGRSRALLDVVLAWAWNLGRLPDTYRARRQVQRARLVGDEELFRYQLRGSSALRQLGEEMADRLRSRAARGAPGRWSDLVEMGQGALAHPASLSLAVVGLFVLAASREVWMRALPLVGYALPPSPSGWDALRSYAGGWNVAGLGSTEPLRPAVAASALAQLVFFDRAELAAAALTVGALLAGVLGTARLLRGFSIGAYGRYAAGAALVGGPATRFMLADGHWPGLLALSTVPWVLWSALRPWPSSWRRRAGRLALTALLLAWGAAYAPLVLLVPPAALLAWALLGDRQRWAAARAAAGALIASLALFPWLGTVDPASLVSAGRPAFWTPSSWAVGLFLAALLALLLAGGRRLVALGGWGGVLVALGAVAARTGSLGWGNEAAMAGLVTAATGTALLTGAALELWAPLPGERPWRRTVGWLGAAAGITVVAGSLLLVAGGRAGLPADRFRDALRFTTSRQVGEASARALLLGPAETLPGDHRQVEGAAYRLVSTPVPHLWEAWLPGPQAGDRRLEEVLGDLAAGDSLRVGEALAPFGIRWVVLTGPTPFQASLEVQLDLQPLSGLDYPVFENEVAAFRAIAGDGTPWQWSAPGYRGEARPDGRLYLAENADDRWMPGPWERAGWANRVSAAQGRAWFPPLEDLLLMARGAAVLMLSLVALAWWGRGEAD